MQLLKTHFLIKTKNPNQLIYMSIGSKFWCVTGKKSLLREPQTTATYQKGERWQSEHDKNLCKQFKKYNKKKSWSEIEFRCK